MAPTCIFCKSEFCDKATLNKHQKTSKYCIKIQVEKEPNKSIERDVYECEFCKRQLTTKQTLNIHLNTCKERKCKDNLKDKEIEILQNTFQTLKKEKDKRDKRG